MSNSESAQGLTAATIDKLQGLANSELLAVDQAALGGEAIPLITIPEGREIKSLQPLLDEWLSKPRDHAKSYLLEDEASFIELANHFKTNDTKLYVTPDFATTAVFNHANKEETSFERHRAKYAPKYSPEWEAWWGHNEKMQDQRQFAHFLEDNVADLYAPDQEADANGIIAQANLFGAAIATPSQIMQCSAGLRINVKKKVSDVYRAHSGEIEVALEEEHQDGNGKKINVPQLFAIAIPLFSDGPLYRIIVRLKYRESEGKVSWHYSLYKWQEVKKACLADYKKRLKDSVSVDVLIGYPS